jgi:peptidoglycan/xylan/chitin deacetylase (PgdA/CDA1 family)
MADASAAHAGSGEAWRGDAAAVFVMSFDVDAESAILAVDGRYAEHPMILSHQAYGPRVAVPRLLAMLADCGVRASFFVPGYTVDAYPATVEQIAAAGHEVAHHSYSHRSPATMTEDEERDDFERAMSAFERVGVRPLGHRAAVWDPSWRTTALVAEHGMVYDSSLMDDDRPYILETASGDIVELPVHWSLDDWQQYFYLPEPALGATIEPPGKVFELWRSELDAMRRHHCLFVLTNHPFLSGRPGRVEGLRRLIEHGLEAGDVQFSTALEVATRARSDPGTPCRRHERPGLAAEVY